MRKLVIGMAVLALASPSLLAPAFAQKPAPDAQLDYEDIQSDADDAYDGDEALPPDQGYQDEDQDDQDQDAQDDGQYAGDNQDYRGETWRDGDGQVRCRRGDGTTGLIVGGAAGGLVGRGIDTRGERGTGTIIGAIAGALVGRAVEQGSRCR